MNVSSERLAAKLADPTLAASLSHFVRARVPPTAVEDIVQSTLAEALDAERHPNQDEDIVRWVHGICRHKVVDWFRRARREVPYDLEGGDDGAVAAAESAPQGASDLLRWAQKELPEGEENAKTLEWMLREGEGEKLETIAAEANLPAPRVRQRVSRLRRYYKARWAAQAAALAALLLIALAIALSLRRRHEEVAPAPGPSFAPSSMPEPLPMVPELPPSSSPAMSVPPQDAPPPSSTFDDEGGLKPMLTPKPAPTGSSATPTKAKPRPRSKMDSFGSSMAPFDPTSAPTPVPAPPAPTQSLDDFGKKPSPK
jgi:DNA-directed RNA polymerase specialized sigma24 family protein